jgi:hypothetical protein
MADQISESDHRQNAPVGPLPKWAVVIYCQGCQRAWIEPCEECPGCCACNCTDRADPLYEAWVTSMDLASIPPEAGEP